MTVRFVRPVSHSAYLGRRLALSALLLFAIATIAHRFGPLSEPTFLALLLLGAAIAAASLPLLLFGLARLWQVGADGGIAATKGLIYAALPLGVVIYGATQYYTLPAIYDVSSDLADPPSFIAEPHADQQWLKRPASPAAGERRAQIAAYPGMVGRRYEGALDRVYEGVRKASLSARIAIGRTQGLSLVEPDLTERSAPKDDQAPVPDVAPVPQARPEPSLDAAIANPTEVVLQGQTRTLIAGLRFDVVIRLREEAETTSVDIRVVSPYGPHDLGFGAQIAQDFLDRLDQELLGLAGG